MKRYLFAFVFFIALGSGWVPRVAAMSVRAPTFSELVAEASVIADARVTSVQSHAVTSPDGQRVIKTFVTFSTTRALKGEPGAEFTLGFLGGTVKGERWSVPGMPAFQVGDDEVLFATAGESVCPLVGAMHGRYRILSDTPAGRRYIARDNRAPLTRTDDVALPMESAASAVSPNPADALTPEEFETRIAGEVARPTPPAAAK